MHIVGDGKDLLASQYQNCDNFVRLQATWMLQVGLSWLRSNYFNKYFI
jgi:hypothetical protein